MAQSISLQTSDSTVDSGDVLGRLNYAASNESSGGDSVSIGASIYAQAEGEFTSTANPTSLFFSTANSDLAEARLRLSSVGHLLPVSNNAINLGSNDFRYNTSYINNMYSNQEFVGTGNFLQSVRTSGTLIFASGNTGSVGLMEWDDGEGTVTLGLKGGNVTTSLAQDNVLLCNNGTASSLSKGQVVYVSGVQGQRPRVNLASAASELTSSRTIGVVDETITSGSEGFVATFGVVTNLNTAAFTAGSGLWLSATTPGALTMTRPVAPNHGVFVGWCLNSHASAGRIFVEVQNGHELDELHDVLITSPVSGELISYDSSNGVWRNIENPSGNLQSQITQNASNIAAVSGIANLAIDGVGTSGFLPRWIGSGIIGNSIVHESGGIIGGQNSQIVPRLHVNGFIRASGDIEFANGLGAIRRPRSVSNLDGVLYVSNNHYFSYGTGPFRDPQSEQHGIVNFNSSSITFGRDLFIGWSTQEVDVRSTAITRLYQDGNHIIAQRNGGSAQTFRLYNTFTSATSFENLQFQWASNEARIGTSVGSAGGTQRNIVMGFWNSAGTWSGVNGNFFSITPGGVFTFSGLATTVRTNAGAYVGNYSQLIFATKRQGDTFSDKARIITEDLDITNSFRTVLHFDASISGNFIRMLSMDGVLIGFGGLTSSFPAIKRNAAALNFRLADDSADAAITAGSGTFSNQVAITQATANTSVLTSTGYSLTGSNAQSMIDVSGVWNTTGTPTLIKANVTDTASNASSLLMDLQTGGTSRFKVDKNGYLTFNSTRLVDLSPGLAIQVSAANTAAILSDSIQVRNVGHFGFTNTSNALDVADVRLFRDAANILAQRNSTNAQTFRLYNTYSSATSYENLQLQWSSNEARIGTSVGSAGGTQRNLVLGAWNASGVFTSGVVVANNGGVTISNLSSSGVQLFNNTPISTTNTLYNVSGILHFNGSAVDTNTTYTAGSGLSLVGTQFNVWGGSGHFVKLDVNGPFTATTKSFLINHPLHSGMKLQYGSLEGPENGVYARGTTASKVIDLPEYWKELVNEMSITVTLTPLNEFQPLCVKHKDNRRIIVGGVHGEYDYVVYGERKDVSKLKVEWWA